MQEKSWTQTKLLSELDSSSVAQSYDCPTFHISLLVLDPSFMERAGGKENRMQIPTIRRTRSFYDKISSRNFLGA